MTAKQIAWQKARAEAPAFRQRWGIKKFTQQMPRQMVEFAFHRVYKRKQSRWPGAVYQKLCYMSRRDAEIETSIREIRKNGEKTIRRALKTLEHDWHWIVMYPVHYGQGQGQRLGIILLHKVRP